MRRQQPNNSDHEQSRRRLIRKKIDRLQVLHVDRFGKRERTLTLICGSGYHNMNSTCIYEWTGGPNIYMHMKGKIYKEPPEGIQ
jgi:hypothetical protein